MCESATNCATLSRRDWPTSARSTSSLANAGILPMAMGRALDAMSFVDASDVDLLGVMNTVAVAIPHLPDGASVIITGSTAGMIRGTTDNPNMGPGGRGYGWSKRVLIEYVEEMSMALAERMIRVNAIHPTNCNTHLLQNDGMYSMFRPDLTAEGKQATREDAEPLFTIFQAMPIPYVEPEDIANLGVFLASDESRYITGQQIRVDGGSLAEVAQRTWGITRSVVAMQEAVQNRLDEFVDDRLSRRRPGFRRTSTAAPPCRRSSPPSSARAGPGGSTASRGCCMPSALIWLSTVSARRMSAMPAPSISSSLSPSDATRVSRRP